MDANPLKRPSTHINRKRDASYSIDSSNHKFPNKGQSETFSTARQTTEELQRQSFGSCDSDDSKSLAHATISEPPIKHIKTIRPPSLSNSESIVEVTKHYNSIRDSGRLARYESRSYYVRLYNNWVKSVMIQQAASQLMNFAVLDLCCGEGGDLKKWEKVRPSHYLGIDIAKSRIDDAKIRYNSMNSQLNAFFDVADCFHSPLYINSTGTGVVHHPDSSNELEPFKFDIISCMFSFHYAFETKASITKALENVARHLKPNGVFMITIPKSSAIENLQREAMRSSPPYVANNSLYELEFPECELPDKEQPGNVNPPSPFFPSIKYFFSLKDSVYRCPEFTVPMEVLFPIASSFHLVCESEMDLLKFFDDYWNHPVYSHLLYRFKLLNRRENKLVLYPEELDTIGLYEAVAFVKKE